jgi:hypothetical protein
VAKDYWLGKGIEKPAGEKKKPAPVKLGIGPSIAGVRSAGADPNYPQMSQARQLGQLEAEERMAAARNRVAGK